MKERIPLGLISVLYVVSFAIPALAVPAMEGKAGLVYGYDLFSTARIGGLVFGRPIPIWTANPLFWIAIAMAFRGKWKEAMIHGLGASIFAVAQVVLLKIGFFSTARFLAGVYIWLSSFILLFAYSGCRLYRTDRESFHTSGSLVVLLMVGSTLLAFLGLLHAFWRTWE
ncbi:MAG TPA: hypothetical protein VMT52_19230 [Planctomycetota bacterium]|nr:hypothetical protein [Planctomycetota bacterium]